MRRLGMVLAASLLVAIVGFTGPAALAAPTMAVDPATDLVDGQAVTVTVTGLAPNSLAGVAQCVEGYLIDGCDLGNITNVSTDASGSFTTTVVLNAMLSTPIGAVDCRTSVDQCVLGANTAYDVEGAVWAPIAFDPTGALRPPPPLTVDPPGPLVDGQSITLHASGLTPGTWVSPVLCPIDALSQAECAYTSDSQPGQVANDGSFTTTSVARATFVSYTYDTVDCRVASGACAFTIGPLPATNRTAVAPLTFDPSAPLEPAPELVVAPSTGLVDRQQVAVTGSGFEPNAPVDLRQCVTSGAGACTSVGFAYADAGGGFAIDVRVDTLLWFYGPVLDCRIEDCVLAAHAYGPILEIAVAELSFDPDAPVAPPPELAVTPATDLVDMQVVHVEGSGFDFAYPYPPVPVPVPVTPVAFPTPDGLLDEPALAPAAGETYVDAFLCEGSDPSINRCGYDTLQRLVADAEGDVSGTVQVEATFETYDGPIDCRQAGMACELRVGQPGNPLRLASVALTFDPAAPLAPPPTLEVTPATDLVDGQTVMVVADGMPINRPAFFLQCVVSGQLAGVCANGPAVPSVAADGRVQVTMPVHRTIPFLGGAVDCGEPGTCAIAVRDRTGQVVASAPITFRGSGSTPPPVEPPTSEPPPSTLVEVAPLTTTAATRPSFTG